MSIAVDRIINPGTDYEFSVSESIADLITHGTFTESELSAYMTCGYIDNRVQGIVTPNLSLSQMGDYIDSCMFVPSAVTGFSADYSWNKQFPGDFQYYKRNLLVYSEAGINNGQYLTDQDYTKWYIVLDIDIKKFYLKDNFRTASTVAGFTYTDSNGESVEVYGSYNNTEYQCLWQDDNTATTLFVIGLSIINGKMYFYMDNPHNQAFPKALNSCAIWYDGGITGGTGEEFITDITGTANLSFMPVLNGLPDYTNGQENQTPSQEYISGYTNSNGEFFGLNKGGHGIAYYDATSIAVRDNQIGARITKGMRLAEIFAWAGFKFKFKNTWYKPIISGGIVTGYTDDMSAESEWDDMINVTGNTVPSGPPEPPGPGDDDNNDPISTTGAPFSSGIAHYYITTAGSLVLSHISTALGSWDIENTGKDLFKNLISCKLIKPPTAVPSSSGTFTIYGEQPEYEGSPITISEVTGNPDISFGPYKIPRKFNDFRDYAPYSKAEIFLPYCGWCGLPSHVIGRSVSVHYFTDIIAATCKAIVFCGNNIVAEASGVIGIDIPMSADCVGMKMAGAASGMLAIVSGGVQTGIGAFAAMKGSPGKGISTAVSGLSQVAAGFTQASMALNENTTEISGKNTDGCCIAGTTDIIIKITRPKEGANTASGKVPPGFAHSVGYLCNKAVTVGSVTGLLIADNVDTSGIAGATDAERAEIKRVLETGLIVNSAPE